MTGCLMIATLIIMHSAYLCCWNCPHARSHDKYGFTVVLGQSQESWPGHLVGCCFYIYRVTSRSLLGHCPLWRSGWRRAVNPTPYSRWSMFIITRRKIFSSVGRPGYISVEVQVGLRRRGPRKHSKSDTKAWVGLKAVHGIYTYNEHCWAQDTCKIKKKQTDINSYGSGKEIQNDSPFLSF